MKNTQALSSSFFVGNTCLFAWLLAILTGCSDTRDSKFVDTADIAAAIEFVALNGESLTVTTTMRDRQRADQPKIVLSSGDELLLRTPLNNTFRMAASDGADTEYVVTLNSALSTGRYSVELNRAQDSDAQASHFFLESLTTITSPSSGSEHSLAQPLVVEWRGSSLSGGLTLQTELSCPGTETANSARAVAADAGMALLQFDPSSIVAASCKLQISLLQALSGSADAQLHRASFVTGQTIGSISVTVRR